ncbi:MAG: hypothetical protein EOP84_05635 [Verrucomicrobiaceae bacterium]|nr:MAG: hypothetical protein EOP84_05635 [Verrucomicrobiaceae bacterium]
MQYLGDQVIVLFNGPRPDEKGSGASYCLTLELSRIEESDCDNPRYFADCCIQDFTRVLSDLPGPLRHLWDGCYSRIFDIGYEAGVEPRPFINILNSTTLQAVAQIGGSIQVTIYPYPGGNCTSVGHG